jgi:ketosteroid isomerase-like protein
MVMGMSRPHEDLLRDLYVAFNGRDLDTLLAALAPDVDWPNGWEGGRVHGRAAVRAYWERQWAEIDAAVEPTAFTVRDDGQVAVDVSQTIRTPTGDVLDQTTVSHVYAFDDDGRVSRMDIES